MKKEIRSDPFIFKWPVQEEGYEWVKGLDSQRHLVGRGDIGSRNCVKEPLVENNGLFRDFAAVSPTEGSIREFANRNGDLFHKYILTRDGVPQRKNKVLPFAGASFRRWKEEIGDMKSLLSIWEAILDRTRESRKVLEDVITWSDGGVRYAIRTPKMDYGAWLAIPDMHDPQLLKRFQEGDVFEPARYALQRELNRRIGIPGILSAVDFEVAIVPRLHWTPDYPDQRIIFEPSNLLAAMWLQFLQAITGELRLKRCAVCRKYFQIGPGGRKSNAETCRDACRQRKSREQRSFG